MPSGPRYGRNARGLPGMLALIHQELPSGSSVPLTTSLTCATQLSWAVGTASSFVSPHSRIYAMQSAIHSTCCSIATGMFANTDGLCGPVIVNRLGAGDMERLVVGGRVGHAEPEPPRHHPHRHQDGRGVHLDRAHPRGHRFS